MTIKNRLRKLEQEHVGNGKFYLFKMSDGMNGTAIVNEYLESNGIERNPKDVFVCLRKFGQDQHEKPSWEFMYSNPISR